MVRIVFKVGQEIEDETTQHLGAHFFPGEKIAVRDFKGAHPLRGIQTENLETLVFLGHASQTHYGNYSSEDFCSRLASVMLVNDRSQVQHIYLVGCEMGLSSSGEHSLAEEIANGLGNRGFSADLQVHTIAKPEDVPGEAMYVEVTTKVGLTRGEGNQLGYISAYAANKEDVEKYQQLKARLDERSCGISERVELQSKLRSFENDRHFVRFQNPKAVMDSDQANIFKPNESAADRKKRIETDKPTQDKKRAIGFLERRQQYKAGKPETKGVFGGAISEINGGADRDQATAGLLKIAVDELKLAAVSKWKTVLKKYITNNTGHYIQDEATRKLIDHLIQGKVEKATEFMEKQDAKETKRAPKGGKPVAGEAQVAVSIATPVAPPVTPVVRPPAASATHDSSAVGRAQRTVSNTGIFAQPTLAGTREQSKELNDLMSIKENIRALVTDLNKEIAILTPKTKGIHWMNRYELQTKTVKSRELTRLSNMNNLTELQNSAKELMKDSRVMRSMRHSRTKVLLTQIVEGKFDDLRAQAVEIRACSVVTSLRP